MGPWFYCILQSDSQQQMGVAPRLTKKLYLKWMDGRIGRKNRNISKQKSAKTFQHFNSFKRKAICETFHISKTKRKNFSTYERKTIRKLELFNISNFAPLFCTQASQH